MKRTYGIFGIVLILIISALASPCIGLEIDDQESLKWKILIVIGIIDVCFDEKVISGFGFIGYNARDLIILERINIQFEGIAIVVTHTLFYTFCIYNPVDF